MPSGEVSGQYEQLNSSMQILLADMRLHAENPSGTDATEASFYQAALDKVACSPQFGEMISTFIGNRPELTRNHTRYLLVRSFQKMAVRSHPRYPNGFDTDIWAQLIDDVLDDSEKLAEVTHDLTTRHLNTNIPDRYKSLPPIVAWMRAHGRIEHGVSMLDIGSSVNHGLKKLALMDIVHGEYFSNTVVVEPVDFDRPWTAQTEDPALTDKVNHLQNQPIGLRTGIGVDRDSMFDTDSMEWARACLTPREFGDGTVEAHDKLDAINPPNVSFSQYNFLDNYESEYLFSRNEDHEFFDIVTLFTVLNQLTDRERYRLLSIARHYVKPTGLVVVQDFARVNPDTSHEIMFLDADWNKNFSYHTIIFDKLGGRGYQEVWLYDGGRCRTAQATLGKIAANGAQEEVPFKQFLRET